MAKIKKRIKSIKVDVDKCNGCRTCEVVCSAFHSEPKYSGNNPAKSRIQIIRYPLRDIWLPVFAGEYTRSECLGRDVYIIGGKEYEECAFCRATCPSRSMFKDPDSGLPLKCDMCEGEENGPLCVEWCLNDVLVFTESEEEVEKEEGPEEMEVGLEALASQYGLDKIIDTLSRMSTAKNR